MADDIDAYLAQKAASSQAQGHGVAPVQAVAALRDGPSVGVPAPVAMHASEDVTALADAQRKAVALKSSPALSSFISSDPAKAAASANDYKALGDLGALARVTMPMGDYIAQGGPWGDFTEALKANLAAGSAAHGRLQEAKTKGDVAGAAMSGATELWNAVGLLGTPFAPLAEGIARGLYHIPVEGVAATDANGRALRDGNGKIIYTRDRTPAEIAQQAEFGGGLLSAVVPVPQLPRLYRRGVIDAGTFGEVRPLLPGAGPVIHDAEFTPVHPPGVNPESDAIHATVADAEALRVQALQAQAANVSTHAEAPGLTADFLDNHSAIAGQTAYVPPEEIVKLWQEGHEVFPSMKGAITDAVNSGRDLEVPLGTYVAETAGKPFEEALRMVTRFNPQGVSQQEAKDLGTFAPPEVSQSVAPTIPEDIPPEYHAGLHTLAAKVDETVDQVFAETSLDKLFKSSKDVNMSKGLFDRYAERVDEARVALHSRLMERAYNQIRRERTPVWKDLVARKAAEVEDTIVNSPAIRARAAIQYSEGPKGEPLEPLKFDRARAVQDFGEGTVASLPRAMFSAHGFDPEYVAQQTGYDNATNLVNDLLDLEAGRVEGEYANGKAHTKALIEEAAQSAARKELGYDITPEGLLEAAREAVTTPAVQSLLTSELQYIASLIGQPLDKAAIEFAAQKSFDAMDLKSAVNVREFERTLKKLGDRAEKALIDGKPIEAFKAKQQQLLIWHQLKMAHFLRGKVIATEKKFRYLAKKKNIKKLAQPYLDQIHALLPGLGFRTRRDPGELAAALNGVGIEEFTRRVISENPAFPAVPSPISGNMAEMSVDQFWNVRNFMYALDGYGREVNSVLVKGARADFDANMTQLLANAPPARAQPPARMGPRKSFMESMASKFKAYDAAHRKIADIGEFFDKGEQGVMANVIENPIEHAADLEGRLLRDVYAAVDKAFWNIPSNVRSSYSKVLTDHPFVSPDGRPLEVTRADIPAMALYVGEDSALGKLAEGYGAYPPDVLEFIDRHITKEEVEFVQTVWDKFEALSGPVSETLRAMTGTGLEKLPPRAWHTPHGTYRGGYWPIRYNRTLDRSALAREAERAVEVGLDPVNQFFADVAPERSFSIRRTNYSGPVLIDLGSVTRAFDSHIKYAAYARPVASIRRFINDARFAELVTTRMGKEYYDQYKPWLDHIVVGNTISDQGTASLQGIANQMRTNLTIAALGFSYNTGISQMAGLTAAIGVVGDNPIDGLGRVLYGMGQWGRLAMAGRTGEVFAKSEFMRQRFGEVEPNMAQAMNSIQTLGNTVGEVQHHFNQLQRAGLAYIGWVELATVSGPMWIAAEAKALGKLGMSAEDAVAYADRAVRKSQGSGRRADLAAVQREKGFLGWFYMFNTWFATQYQRLPEAVRAASGGDYGKAFNLFLTVFVLGPIAAAALTGDGPKDNDPMTLFKWAMQKAAFNFFRPFFLIGNASSNLDRNIEVHHGKYTKKRQEPDFSGDPSARTAEAIYGVGEVGMNAITGKPTKRPLQKTIQGVGLATGFPGSYQIAKTTEYWAQLLGGQQVLQGSFLDQAGQFLSGTAHGPKPVPPHHAKR